MSETKHPVAGYVVGQTPNGDVIFQVIGEPRPGLFQLLGAHAYAAYELKKIEDAFHQYGSVQVGTILNKLLKDLDISFQALKRDAKIDSTAILEQIKSLKEPPSDPETDQ